MFLSHKNKIRLLGFLALFFVVFACEDEESAPIVTFDSAGKGAYPRLIGNGETGDFFVNLFDPDNFSYSVEVEFVDASKGSSVTQFVFDLEFDDNDPSNGDNSTLVEGFLVIEASAFSTSEGGFTATTVNISGSDMYSAVGITSADISVGDEFDLIGKVVTSNGNVFTDPNSSASITGSAFRGYFGRTFPATCPSDLTGDYAYETSSIWCDGSTTSGTVTIVALGGGTYRFNDWSFGSYGVCYGGGTAGGDLTFTEVCAEVSFTGFTDSFGDTWTYVSSISGEEWTIQWSNTYSESGTTVITFPGGVPFTLN